MAQRYLYIILASLYKTLKIAFKVFTYTVEEIESPANIVKS